MWSFVFLFVGSVNIALGADWGYASDGHGPDNWDGHCNDATKTAQSPINIRNAQYKNMDKFYVSDYGRTDVVLTHVGHAVQVNLPSSSEAKLSGGDLDDTFKLDQFHFHWGSSDNVGSEHQIDGKQYPLEVHFVHHNIKYPDLSTAADKEDGLAVLGFLFEIGEENENYKDIIKSLPMIKHEGATHPLAQIDITSLLENTKTFYRYTGSLTTPPCYESVTWTVFTDTIKISSAQMAEFRSLIEHEEKLKNNYRPIQPVGDRLIHTNTAAYLTNSVLLITAMVSWNFLSFM